MQLLRCTVTPTAEFVSLSLLIRPDPTLDTGKAIMGEPMMLVSPVTTLSMSNALDAVKELHNYMAVSLKASTASLKATQNDRVEVDLLKEDERQMEAMQIYRPCCSAGIGLHFQMIRGEKGNISTLSNMILACNKSNANKQGGQALAAGVLGVVLCVAISGLPYAYSNSSLQYSLTQRLKDCTSLLSKAVASDTTQVKVLLATFLLSEEEERKTNAMMDAANLTAVPDQDDVEKAKSPMNMISPIALRIKRSTKGATGNVQFDADAMFNFGVNSAEAARAMADRLNVLSVAESDTFLRKYEQSGQERKMNLDLTAAGAKSRFRRKRSEARDADFDGFDYKGPKKEVMVKKSLLSSAPEPMPLAANNKQLQLRQPKKDTRTKVGGSSVPALSAPRGDLMAMGVGSGKGGGRASGSFGDSPGGGHIMVDDGNSMLQSPNQTGKRGVRRNKSGQLEPQKGGKRSGRHSGHFDDETSVSSKSHSIAVDSASSQARVQVNIALNEDLSCSYKVSQLSSCSVEGVVQVQVKSNARNGVPFFLLVRDPSGQLESLQENKKYADDVSDTIVHEREVDADRKFTVNVPKADNYFPVLRYKCVSELRPVPIRVQTRVKVDGGFCRVALQISSNPNNEANLTDLTIIMGVPDEVRGETLVTQPAGGVWNESKRSVIWCVSELGDGEKFQLQARFEMENNVSVTSEADKPKFPVLVRCQCLFAQLSDIELEVRDIPDVFPADVAMKVARRFRLSHRERS